MESFAATGGSVRRSAADGDRSSHRITDVAERHVIELASDASQVAVARRFARSVVRERASARGSADVELVVSELVANVIEHSDVASIPLAIAVDASQVTISVTTGASPDELGPVDTWRVAAVDEVSGRGLGMVRELADHVAVIDSEGGAVVQVTFASALSDSPR